MARRKYWLMKSEPEVYGLDHLERDGTTAWDGVRNYRARNLMRDEMQVGDGVLYYHSNADPPAVVGLARVASEAHPDETQFDKRSRYYDPKASRSAPRWMCVDIGFVARFERPVTLPELRADTKVEGMALLQKGQRLSVQPVTPAEWRHICKLGGVESF